MPYLFKQQFTITDLLPRTVPALSVVIAEPEIYLAKLAGKYLLAAGLEVNYCPSPVLLMEFLRRTCPAALLINPRGYLEIKHAAKGISDIRDNFPGLAVVTIAHNLEAEELGQLMSAGVASHINRQLSRPQDVADIIKTLINFK
jgi:hypothetical protein